MRTLYYPGFSGQLNIVVDGLGGTDSPIQTIRFKPRSFDVNLNDYRHADTFEIEFDAKVFPISPENIRTGSVKLWAYDNEIARDGSLLTSENEERANEVDDNLLIEGIIDEGSLRYSQDGRSVSYTGRDFTTLLIEKEWPTNKRVPVGKDLKQAVQELVDKAVKRPIRGIKDEDVATLEVVYYDTSDVKTRDVGKGLTHKTVTEKPKTGANHSKAVKKGFPQKTGKTYWDVIYGLCVAHGKICYVRGRQVIISDRQTLNLLSFEQSAKMVLGKNLADLEIRRKFSRTATPQIVARCYDHRTRAPIECKHPPDKDIRKVSGVNTVREEIMRVLPPLSIADRKTLQAYVKEYYESVARSEADISFSTGHLRDVEDRHLLRLRPGSPVRIEYVNETTDLDMRTMSLQQRERRLMALGYGAQVARLVAANYERLRNQARKPYYTKTVHITGSMDNGIAITVTANNYVAPSRDDIEAYTSFDEQRVPDSYDDGEGGGGGGGGGG